eukprot:TRINITY_DN12351_c0_g1_i1.p1 TRINITY_DN12351_c0_g1~~TRINITY_DN12351_c0_g1_i1.p1  ORF type:complete len:561 (+),score=124.75 TRINITY_DN12351_c0_g1_i1:88-1683(+)
MSRATASPPAAPQGHGDAQGQAAGAQAVGGAGAGTNGGDSPRGGSGGSSPVPDGAGAAAPQPAPSLLVFAAGRNGCGQCGLPAHFRGSILSPRASHGLQAGLDRQVAKISCGQNIVIMLTRQGAVLHAGANVFGQRGIGTTDFWGSEPHADLHPVPLPGPAVDIVCGDMHVVVILEGGAAVTWGHNNAGQLGRPGDSAVPAVVESVSEVEHVFAGPEITFFVNGGGEVLACGKNNWGQLCLGNNEMCIRLPQRAAELCGRRIVQLQAGAAHCILLEADGSILVWGYLGGRLADGSDSWSAAEGCVPIRLGLGPAACVAAGESRSAAVTADGALVLWGDGLKQPTPIACPGGAPASAVQCSRDCVFALLDKVGWAALGEGAAGLPFGSDKEQGKLRPITDGGLSPHCAPLCGCRSRFALYFEGPGAEELVRRSTGIMSVSGVLSVAGRVLWEHQLDSPLCDLGISAEALVHLLRVPQPGPGLAAAAPEAGTLEVFVDAPHLGAADAIHVELHPDATARDLVLVAVAQLGLGA